MGIKKFLRCSTFKNTIIEFLQTYSTGYREFNVGGKILCPIRDRKIYRASTTYPSSQNFFISILE